MGRDDSGKGALEAFEGILAELLGPWGLFEREGNICDTLDHSGQEEGDEKEQIRGLNAAFLAALAGTRFPLREKAQDLLKEAAGSPSLKETALFYWKGLGLVREEIAQRGDIDPDFTGKLLDLSRWLAHHKSSEEPWDATEKIWAVFFPEAAGIRGNEQDEVRELRRRRAVRITSLNPDPVTDVARQVLFTSNVLLTIPDPSYPEGLLHYDKDLREGVLEAAREPQVCWYDHPIPIGASSEQNEVLYGLRGLERALDFERDRGNLSGDGRIACILSVSVTHRGLRDIAREVLRKDLQRGGSLRGIDLYVFTEEDTRRIVREVLEPGAERFLGRTRGEISFDAFGVDGEYGRHYSFLKAIAPFWKGFADPGVKGVFKIDLDQVFPQDVLVEQTGSSAFEHLGTPLWGAEGGDDKGNPLELGMIAGALVNERDIRRSLFTPDVPFPVHPPLLDEHIFLSILPQALSTEAEMMMRYEGEGRGGDMSCIQRIHVTGGTNGILVDSLCRHRPFTPSFIQRAEDQAYIMSALATTGPRLAYVHKDGLIMRHDKEDFAREAVRSAHVGKLVGDYIRILYFSAYAGVLPLDMEKTKEILDPFTGGFISKIPMTVVFLRFALRAARFFTQGEDESGVEFITLGARRIMDAIRFSDAEKGRIKREYERERREWDLYYDTLEAVERAVGRGDSFGLELQDRAMKILEQCAVAVKNESD